MTRFTICDDEPEHCELISRYIKAEYEKRMQGTDIAETNVYQSSADMLAEAVEDTDIFILDIECGDVSGFEVAKRIHEQKKDAGIVFCTSHENYVFQSFGFRPIGFIRKSNMKEDVEHTMYNIISFLNDKKKMLNVSGGRLINIDNIVAVEVYTHALIFRGIDTDMEIRSTLSEYENRLKQYGFIKISRSIMVNKSYVERIEKDKIIMRNGAQYYISRGNVTQVRRMLV